MKEKTRQRLLVIIAIMIFIMVIIGTTYAFFTPNEVVGNADTNIIDTETADYGDTTVHYEEGKEIINTGVLDLKQNEAGRNHQFMLKFYVDTTSTIDLSLSISWDSVTNTFCRYRDNQTCTDNIENTPVTGEVVYDLYNCSQAGYTGTTDNTEESTVSVAEGCTLISGATSVDVPFENNGAGMATASQPLVAGGTNYYVLVLTVKNINGRQNYNQGKNFSGRVMVSLDAV